MNNKTRFSLSGLLIISVVLIFCISLVSAEDTLGTFKQGECVELIQTCSDCTSVNITSIKYPNMTKALGKVSMTKNNTLYNYTYCDTKILGLYTLTGEGDITGTDETFVYDFFITTTGGFSNNLYVPGSILLIALVLFIFSYLSRNLYMGFLSGLLFMILGVYLIIYGFGSIADLYTRGMGFIALGFGALVGISAGYEVVEEMMENQAW